MPCAAIHGAGFVNVRASNSYHVDTRKRSSAESMQARAQTSFNLGITPLLLFVVDQFYYY
jgi:hypothetical protein